MTERITNLITKLWILEPYYADLLTRCQFEADTSINTAGVHIKKDRVIFVFNPKFVESLNNKQLMYLLIHEVLHIVSDHWHRSKTLNLNHTLMNISADMIINYYIETTVALEKYIERPVENIPMIPDIYYGLHTMEEVYLWLLRHGQNFEVMDEGVTVDEDVSEDEAKEAVEKVKPSKHITPDLVKKFSKPVAKKNNSLNTIFKLTRNSKLKKTRTYSRPSLIGTAKGFVREGREVVIILDVSGSMEKSMTKVVDFLLLKSTVVHLIQCDTTIRSIDTFKTHQDFKRLEIHGGGGTFLQPAIDEAERLYSHLPLIIVTDGRFDVINVSEHQNKVVVASTEVYETIIGPHTKVKLTY